MRDPRQRKAYGPPWQVDLSLSRRGAGVVREESILRSKYDLIDGAAESVESNKAGGYNGRQDQQ